MIGTRIVIQKVDLTKQASSDLYKIAEYYDAEQDGLGRQFINEINTKIDDIKQFPFASRPGLKTNTREKILHKFPYTIVYKVIDDRVKILTVYHQHQKRP